MSNVLFRTEQLRYTNPEAFKALPEPYQEDDCLVFWTENGNLFAAPDENETAILGSWEAFFDGSEWVSK